MTPEPRPAAVIVRPDGPSSLRDASSILAEGLTAAGLETLVGDEETAGTAFRFLDPATFNAFLQSPRALDERIRARTVILGADRSFVFAQLEEHRLAGAVTNMRLADWAADPVADRSAGICGLRRLAPLLGWEMSHRQLGTEHYGYLYHPDAPGLAPELAAYLLALAEDLVGEDRPA